jgi:hypothetical protein
MLTSEMGVTLQQSKKFLPVFLRLYFWVVLNSSQNVQYCMYVEGVGQKSGPCTATFNDLLCFPYC